MAQSFQKGLEILTPDQQVLISRFPANIRWLHWINTLFILLLYGLAIHQVSEFSLIGHLPHQDSRFYHILSGLLWIAIILVMMMINVLGRFNIKKAIISDKLIIKQQIFLFFSIVFTLSMAGSGLALWLLKNLDVPEVRGVLHTFHLLIALAYLPALGFHVYLATVKQNTRRSLRTMVSDITLPYILYASIDDLEGYLTNNSQIVYVKVSVNDMSIKGFKAHLSPGDWENKIDLTLMTQVEFHHPALSRIVKMPIVAIETSMTQNKQIRMEYCYAMPIQESAKILLSHALFFRKLFLEERVFLRHPIKIPISLKFNGKAILGSTVNISKGGIGMILESILPKKHLLELDIHYSEQTYQLQGKVVMRQKIERNRVFYGIAFYQPTEEQLKEINHILTHWEQGSDFISNQAP